MVPSQVAKLEERIAKIDTQLDKLRKQEQVEGYEEKVRHSGTPGDMGGASHQDTGWTLESCQDTGTSVPSRADPSPHH